MQKLNIYDNQKNEQVNSEKQLLFMQEEGIDFKRYLFLFIENWYWFIVSSIISLIVVFLVNRYTVPMYQVNSSLIIEERPGVSDGVQSVIQELGIRGNRFRKAQIENEIEVLRSYRYAERAISELDFDVSYMAHGRLKEVHLYKNAPFYVKVDSGDINRYSYPIKIYLIDSLSYNLKINGSLNIDEIMTYGQKYSSKDFNFTIRKKVGRTGYDEYVFWFNNRNSTINKYKKKTSIKTVSDKGSILKLSSIGYIPQKEADYLNKLMEIYLKVDLEEKNIQSQRTIDFIDRQLEFIKDSLQEAERRLTIYRVNKRIVNLKAQSNSILKQLESLKNKQQEIYIRQKYVEQTKNYLEKRDRDVESLIAPSALGLNKLGIEGYVHNYNELVSELKSFSYAVNLKNTEFERKKEELKKFEQAILQSINNEEKSISSELDEVLNTEKELQVIISNLPLSEQNLINIQREYELQSSLYNFLLKKKAEQGIVASSNKADNKILDWAKPDNAAYKSPNKSLNKTVGLIFAIVVPTFLILLIDFIGNRIKSRADIEKRTLIPVIGAIGHNRKETELPIWEYPQSALAETFRSIRVSIEHMLSGGKVIMVTSSVSGEGKTFITSNLAVSLALNTNKVVLLGLDLRKPTIQRNFDARIEKGLSSVLSNQIELRDVCYKTKVGNLDIIPSGPIPPNPSELIGSSKMERILSTLKESYDYIIIDTPPVGIVSDSLLLERFVDLTLFIIRQNYTKKHVFDMLNNLSDKKYFPNKGLLVNDVVTKSYYGYNYSYGYGQYYGYGHNYGNGYYNE